MDRQKAPRNGLPATLRLAHARVEENDPSGFDVKNMTPIACFILMRQSRTRLDVLLPLDRASLLASRTALPGRE